MSLAAWYDKTLTLVMQAVEDSISRQINVL